MYLAMLANMSQLHTQSVSIVRWENMSAPFNERGTVVCPDICGLVVNGKGCENGGWEEVGPDSER